MALGFTLPLFGTGLVNGLWLILIGWFLSAAARNSYQQLVLRRLLEDVPVSSMMYSRLETAPESICVAHLVNEYIMNSDQRAFPVLAADGTLKGLASV